MSHKVKTTTMSARLRRSMSGGKSFLLALRKRQLWVEERKLSWNIFVKLFICLSHSISPNEEGNWNFMPLDCKIRCFVERLVSFWGKKMNRLKCKSPCDIVNMKGDKMRRPLKCCAFLACLSIAETFSAQPSAVQAVLSLIVFALLARRSVLEIVQICKWELSGWLMIYHFEFVVFSPRNFEYLPKKGATMCPGVAMN